MALLACRQALGSGVSGALRLRPVGGPSSISSAKTAVLHTLYSDLAASRGIMHVHSTSGRCAAAVHTLQVARQLGLTTGPVAVVVPLSTFGSWEREMAK